MHLSNTCVAFATDAAIVSALDVVKRLLAEDRANRVLVFCGTQGEEHAEPFEELLALKDRHLDRLSLTFVTNREPDEAELLSGCLDAAKVEALAAKLFDPKSVHEYYVCGPQQLADDVSTALKRVGVEPVRIRRSDSTATANGGVSARARAMAEGAAVEQSTQPIPAPGPSIPNAPTGAATAPNETRVEFVMDGRRRAFTMRTGTESILDGAARAGIDLPFSCKAGVCSTCRTKLVRGQVEMVQNYALEDWELEQGFILACQAHARTPEIELTYDEK